MTMTDAEMMLERRHQANNAVWAFGKITKPTITAQEYDRMSDVDREYADKYFEITETTV